jgi:hypothetical protein
MDTTALREKLHDFINSADDEEVVKLFLMVDSGLGPDYDHWEDEEFVAEMKSRIDDFESGKDKGVSWEEIKLKLKGKRP